MYSVRAAVGDLESRRRAGVQVEGVYCGGGATKATGGDSSVLLLIDLTRSLRHPFCGRNRWGTSSWALPGSVAAQDRGPSRPVSRRLDNSVPLRRHGSATQDGRIQIEARDGRRMRTGAGATARARASAKVFCNTALLAAAVWQRYQVDDSLSQSSDGLCPSFTADSWWSVIARTPFSTAWSALSADGADGMCGPACMGV